MKLKRKKSVHDNKPHSVIILNVTCWIDSNLKVDIRLLDVKRRAFVKKILVKKRFDFRQLKPDTKNKI